MISKRPYSSTTANLFRQKWTVNIKIQRCKKTIGSNLPPPANQKQKTRTIFRYYRHCQSTKIAHFEVDLTAIMFNTSIITLWSSHSRSCWPCTRSTDRGRAGRRCGSVDGASDAARTGWRTRSVCTCTASGRCACSCVWGVHGVMCQVIAERCVVCQVIVDMEKAVFFWLKGLWKSRYHASCLWSFFAHTPSFHLITNCSFFLPALFLIAK